MSKELPSDLNVMNFKRAEDFGEGQVILVNKPLNWTSFDVVNKLRGAIRGALGYRKIKVGHAGTLDPLATGVLVICTGKATKRIAELQAQDKVYKATIRLGAETACLDTELPVVAWTDASKLEADAVRQAAAQWTGSFEQMPPAYSAKKVNGQKAYAIARKGGEINLRPASIRVDQFDIHRIDHATIDSHPVCDVEVTIACAKGTYIRALARDLGKTLHVGGHLTALKRTVNGPFSLQECPSLEDLLAAIHDIPPLVEASAVDL